MHIHAGKPSVADRPASLAVDLVIWHPKDRNEQVLVQQIAAHGFGERSQTIVWLDKFTVRLTMWRRRYFSDLDEADWAEASRDLEALVAAVHEHYHPRSIEVDTRAFTVGLHRGVRKRRVPVSALHTAPKPGTDPVYWEIRF